MREGDVDEGRASATRVKRYLPALAAILVGCGSSSAGGGPSSSESVAGFHEAANQLLAQVGATRYDEACEALTPTARATLDNFAGGCTGALATARPVLLEVLPSRIRAISQPAQVREGDVVYQAQVLARYEHGGWHFENNAW